MTDAAQFTLRTVPAMAEFEADAWNRCALTGAEAPVEDGTPPRPANPFLEHAFLHALEASGSAVPETGWQPVHLALETPEGELVGTVPMYLKGHSQGEYIFDHAWADAFHRAGGRYYPKLLVAVPFTPATGPRLLARRDTPLAVDTIQDALVQGLVQVTEQTGASSVHVNFATADEAERMGRLGLLQRVDQQFHWLNAGYGTFDDFLGELSSKKRKNLKRERRQALEPGIEIEHVTGDDLREHHFDAFYEFYVDTGARKWGTPYLTRDFFTRIARTMADRVLLILARREGRYVAGALNFIGADTLYGRHWGCTEHHPSLHFEVCYYQAIDFAIAHGLSRVEAGAQGGHKVARGYLPCATHSAHWIAHPGLRDAIADYLERERAWVGEDMANVEAHAPFRSDVDPAMIRARAGKATGVDPTP